MRELPYDFDCTWSLTLEAILPELGMKMDSVIARYNFRAAWLAILGL